MSYAPVRATVLAVCMLAATLLIPAASWATTEAALPTADLVVTGAAAPDTVVTGATEQITWTVTNNGPAAATNAHLDTMLPIGLSATVNATLGGTCTAAPAIVCSWASLASGATATVTVSFTSPLGVTGSFAAHATVDSDTPSVSSLDEAIDAADPRAADVMWFAATSAPAPSYDLAAYIDPYPSAKAVTVGSNHSLWIGADNNGSADLNGALTVSVDVPAGWSIISVDAGCSIVGGSTVVCLDGAGVFAGDFTEFEVVVRPTVAHAFADEFRVRAWHGPDDEDLADNFDVLSLRAVPAGNVNVNAAIAGPATAVAGATATEDVTVFNTSGIVSGAYTTTTTVTGGTIVSASGTGWTACTTTATTVTCSGPSLNNNQQTWPLHVNVTRGTAGGVSVSTHVATAAPDFDPSGDTASRTTQFTDPVENLTTTVSGDNSTAIDVGGNVAVTGGIAHVGTGTAHGASISFTFGSGMTPAGPFPGGCTAVAQVVTCTVGDLVGATSQQRIVSGTVSSAGPTAVRVHVLASDGNDNVVDDDATLPVTGREVVDTRPVFEVTSWTGAGAVAVGSTASIRTLVSNRGAASAAHLRIGLPASASLPVGPPATWATTRGSCSLVTNGLDCDLGVVPAHSSTIVDISPTLATAGSFEVTAALTGATSEILLDDNFAFVSLFVAGSAEADLVAAIDDIVDSAYASTGPTGSGAATLRATVENRGPSAATDTQVSIPVHGGETVNSVHPSQGSCTVGVGVITCALGTLGSRAGATIVVDATMAPGTHTIDVTASSATTDSAPDDNSASTTFQLDDPSSADLVMVFGPPAVAPGSDFTAVQYQIMNRGMVRAVNPVVTFHLPPGATVVRLAPTAGASCGSLPAPGGSFSCTLDNVSSGKMSTIGTITIDPTTSGRQTLFAEVRSASADAWPLDNAAYATWSSAPPSGDVSARAFGPAQPLPVGAGTRVRIDVRNEGGAAAHGATLTLTMPAGVSVTAPIAGGDACTGTTTITCPVGTIGAGEYVSLEVPLQIGAVGSHALGIHVTSTSDADTSNDDSSVNVDGLDGPGHADVQLVWLDVPTAPIAGSKIRLAARVRNNGPDDASGAQVTMTLPTGIAYDGAFTSHGDTCGYDGTSHLVTCPLGTLADSASVAIDVRGTLLATPASFDVTATVSSGIADSNAGNDARTAHVAPVADFGAAPASLSFPVTKFRSVSAPVSVTITSPSQVSIGSPRIGGAQASQFSISSTTCAPILFAGDSCVVSVVHRPTAGEGVQRATLDFLDERGRPVHVSLTATADDPTTGTPGLDRFQGGAAGDIFSGFGGADVFHGAGGNDTFRGGAGNDSGYGDAGRDSLFGEAGNDKLFGGPGADKLNGGPGNDVLDARDKKPGDVVDCGPGKDTALVNKGDKVLHCERVKRSR